MTEAERMAALADTLARLSDELIAASVEFEILAWRGHVSHLTYESSLLLIYSSQIRARAKVKASQ